MHSRNAEGFTNPAPARPSEPALQALSFQTQPPCSVFDFGVPKPLALPVGPGPQVPQTGSRAPDSHGKRFSPWLRTDLRPPRAPGKHLRHSWFSLLPLPPPHTPADQLFSPPVRPCASPVLHGQEKGRLPQVTWLPPAGNLSEWPYKPRPLGRSRGASWACATCCTCSRKRGPACLFT